MNGEEAEAAGKRLLGYFHVFMGSPEPNFLHPLFPQTMESREENKGFAKHKRTFWPTQKEGLLPRSTEKRSWQPQRVTFIEVAEVKTGKQLPGEETRGRRFS